MAESFGRTASATLTNLVTGIQVEVRDLRIKFRIVKSDKAADNKAQITIYNLSKATRNAMQSQVSEGGKPLTQVELRAGYKTSEEKVLFRGTGETVSSRKPPEWETEITAEDGIKQLKEAKFEKKYPAATSVQTIVDELLQAAGITTTIKVALVATIPRARTFSGDPLANIQDLQSTYKFEFDIQDQEAIVKPKDAQATAPLITTLGKDTGLINSPRVKGGLVLVDALLDGNLKPNNFVRLDTRVSELSGTYLIKKGTYTGDTWSGNWTASLELERASVDVLAGSSNFGGALA